MPKPRKQKQIDDSGLNFEAQLWAAADKMRGHMDASEYKHVCLCLISESATLATLRDTLLSREFARACYNSIRNSSMSVTMTARIMMSTTTTATTAPIMVI